MKEEYAMKKWISFLMIVTLCVVSLTACTSRDQQQEDNSTPEASEISDNSDDKVLVVYYSASGNTKAIAEMIASYNDADTFEIVPVDSYSDEDLNWRDANSRVNREHEDESLQDIELVSTTVDDFDSYQTVFIGYPIWWGNASWVVNRFVEENDFDNKTVIPFCTSTSSGIGSSASNLADLAGSGDWQEGQRFQENADEDTVIDWLESLGF